MKYFNKKNTQNKETTKLPMGKKSKKALAVICGRIAVHDLLHHNCLCRQ